MAAKALQLYADATVLVDGILLTEHSSVTIDKKSGLNPVYTVGNEFAGMAPGSPVVEISVDNAIPAADFELNPDPIMKTYKIVDLQIIIGASKSMNCKAFLTEASYSHAVNEASKLNMKFMARFAEFE